MDPAVSISTGARSRTKYRPNTSGWAARHGAPKRRTVDAKRPARAVAIVELRRLATDQAPGDDSEVIIRPPPPSDPFLSATTS